MYVCMSVCVYIYSYINGVYIHLTSTKYDYYITNKEILIHQHQHTTLHRRSGAVPDIPSH